MAFKYKEQYKTYKEKNLLGTIGSYNVLKHVFFTWFIRITKEQLNVDSF